MVSRVAPYEIRERLSDLLRRNLDFRNGERGYALHSLHAFAARFPAQLPRYFIEGLSAPGETVLDPMGGSGATLVEGWLLSRNVIGLDMDPLAIRLCKVKTTWLDPEAVYKAGQRVTASAWLLSRMSEPLARFTQRLDEATQGFIDYWFTKDTQNELAALILSIEEEPEPQLRSLFEVLVSGVIVTKSGGVSMARDLAHSRPHLVKDKTPRSAVKMFQAQLLKAVRAFEETRGVLRGRSTVLHGDARYLPLPENCVDLIVTSPPYANALDYVRAHKFSLAWLGESVKQLSTLRGQYIGAERWAKVEGVELPERTELEVNNLAAKDTRKARVLDKYYRDMSLALREMYRVLRPWRTGVMVVGPSIMRGFRIETHENLASIARRVGFDVVGVAKRPLDRDRRMMPARWHNNGQSLIEQRIHEEFVIGLMKPERE